MDILDERARIRSFLDGLIRLSALITAIVSLIYVVSVPAPITVIIPNGSLLLCLGVSWLLLKGGYLDSASSLLLLGFWIYLTVSLAVFGGLGTPLVAAFILLIQLGGTLLGQRGLVTMTVLTGLASLALLLLDIGGALPIPAVQPTALQTWMTLFSIALGAGVIFWLWDRSIRRAVAKARKEMLERQQAQNSLVESEQRYRQAITAASAVPYHLDYKTRKYLFLGENIQQLTGYPAAELTPDFFAGLIEESQMLPPPPAAGDGPGKGPAGLVWKSDFRIRTRLGEVRWLSDTSLQIPGENGQPGGAFGILQDISERKLSEEALRKSEETYRLISSVISDYSFYTRVNADGSAEEEWGVGAFEGITGYADFESFVAAGGWAAHLHPDDAARDALAVERLKRNERVSTELRTIRRDGQVCWVRLFAHPDWDEQAGRLKGIYGAVQDISLHKQTEAREERHHQMLIRVIELGKAVTRISDLPECLRAIHQSLQSVLGFDQVRIYLYNQEANSIQGAYGTGADGHIQDISAISCRADENPNWMMALQNPGSMSIARPADAPAGASEVNLAAWSGDRPVAILSVDNLVRAQPFAPEQLEALQLFAGYVGLAIENARLKNELEGRVRLRTLELENAIQELEAFTYTVSHDLRAPLRGIHGYASLLAEKVSQGDPADSEYVHKIQSNAKAMGALIDDLLRLSRTGKQPIKKQAVDLKTLAEEIFEQLRREEPGRKMTLALGDLPPCQADPSLIRQVMTNLLANAVKYTRNCPEARIVFSSRPQGGRMIYTLQDNGVGFNMKYANKLFGVFQRLHSTEEFDGTGVGLAIVQRIIQRHGGDIWAEGKEGEGATFHFWL